MSNAPGTSRGGGRFPRRGAWWSKRRSSNKGRGGQRGNSGHDNGNHSEEEDPNDPDLDSSRISNNSTMTRGTSNKGGRGRKRDHDSSATADVQPRKRRNTTASISKQIHSQWSAKYPGYDLYFPYSNPIFPDAEVKLSSVTDYLLRNELKIKKSVMQVEEQENIDINCDDIIKDDDFREGWPSFLIDLEETPKEVLNLWGLAVHKIIFDTLTKIEEDSLPEDVLDYIEKLVVPFIRVGIMRHDPVLPLKSIRASCLGKLITIRGAIVRTGILKSCCIRQTFRCNKCREIVVTDQPEGRYTLPLKCQTEDCHCKTDFEPVLRAVTTKVIDYRRIRIQDVENGHLEQGRIPRTVDCDLFYDLAKQCNAGDVVTLSGVVKMTKDTGKPGTSDQSLHDLYIEVVSIRNHKDSDRTMGGHWFSFSNKDYYAVKEIFECEKLFRLLVASLCPGIFGMELIKAGILLALFGGTSQDKEIISRRPDINVLVVGDPGLGKSQLLKIVSEVTPRGIYVCGNGSTTAGLTVTLVRDGDEYSLEAGALVMADRGVCCIDEFDKMQCQHSALLEAMEQQSVSVAKAGLFRTIPARTTVIAAANPVAGHYDNTKTVTENIHISAPLLSRFDLIFILQDRADKGHDRNIVEHITGFRRGTGQYSSRENTVSTQSHASSVNSLLRSLKFSREESVDLIPHHLLRKYIAYARQYVHPKISPEAAVVLKDYYLNLRKHHRHVDATPVTTRQLESLVRLAEARAKAELRETVSVADAKDVLEIFNFNMQGVYDNDLEVTIGQEITESPSSMSFNITPSTSRALARNMAKKLAGALQLEWERTRKNTFTTNEIKEIARSRGIESGVDRLVDCLNNGGILLKKGNGLYQLDCPN